MLKTLRSERKPSAEKTETILPADLNDSNDLKDIFLPF
jgi:hypothetical protein